jgi:hypothetical protein
VLLGDRAEWRELATACIGEENVDLATMLLNSVLETVDIGELAHIALHAVTITSISRRWSPMAGSPPPGAHCASRSRNSAGALPDWRRGWAFG